jgi:hypothetical protein
MLSQKSWQEFYKILAKILQDSQNLARILQDLQNFAKILQDSCQDF